MKLLSLMSLRTLRQWFSQSTTSWLPKSSLLTLIISVTSMLAQRWRHKSYMELHTITYTSIAKWIQSINTMYMTSRISLPLTKYNSSKQWCSNISISNSYNTNKVNMLNTWLPVSNSKIYRPSSSSRTFQCSLVRCQVILSASRCILSRNPHKLSSLLMKVKQVHLKRALIGLWKDNLNRIVTLI